MGPALESWNETGHRLLRIIRLDGLTTAEVAYLYTSFLPGIHAHANALGRDAWEDWVRQEVTHGKATPVRLVENHTRLYVRRMAENFEEIAALEDVAFNEDMFLFTLSEVLLAPASGKGKTKH